MGLPAATLPTMGTRSAGSSGSGTDGAAGWVRVMARPFPAPISMTPASAQLFQMEVDGGGGPQANGLANLPDRRGIPLRLDAGGNVIIDPLLHGRKHEMTSILLAASGSCAGAMYFTVSIP